MTKLDWKTLVELGDLEGVLDWMVYGRGVMEFKDGKLRHVPVYVGCICPEQQHGANPYCGTPPSEVTDGVVNEEKD